MMVMIVVKITVWMRMTARMMTIARSMGTIMVYKS